MGAGKSTVARMLAKRGASILDTDALAREVTAPGAPGHAQVVLRFGPAVASIDGDLDRRALASVVFADPVALADLEAIVHPLVGAEIERRLALLPDDAVAVVEVPLLDQERRERYHLAPVVLVRARPQVSLARAVARGFSPEDVRARQAAQPTQAERLAVADIVIDNDAGLPELGAAVAGLWHDLKRQAT